MRIYYVLKDNSGILNIEPPFWFVYDEIEWLTPNVHYWSCLRYLAHFESSLPAWEWLATSMHKPLLKTTLNICFLKCATHRVVSGVRWWSKSSIAAKYSLSCSIWHFVNTLIHLARWPETERGAGCSLFARSSPTVDTVDFRFRSGFRFNGIHIMSNKTPQKLCFATILDLGLILSFFFSFFANCAFL